MYQPSLFFSLASLQGNNAGFAAQTKSYLTTSRPVCGHIERELHEYQSGADQQMPSRGLIALLPNALLILLNCTLVHPTLHSMVGVKTSECE